MLNFILYLRAGIKCIVKTDMVSLIAMALIYFLLEFADLYCTFISDEWDIKNTSPNILMIK